MMAGTNLHRMIESDQGESTNTLVIRLRSSRDKAPKPSLILRGLQASKLEKNMFMFSFRDERDKMKVLMKDPWHFDRNVLVLQAIEGNEQPSSIDLFQTPFWVQLHDLPFDYRDPEVAKMIGKKLGFFRDVYKEEDWEMLSFLTIKVIRKNTLISKAPWKGGGASNTHSRRSGQPAHPAIKPQYGNNTVVNVIDLVK
ncbi:hypothetical protein Tsubulata_031297 [Turnera subulata]|uniref:DUF4283 domain-containing protein n=1 Tax=Turnera subulata TaxID=218843 RepID=A0A9Q0G881_9ROSI|nr:hypothetical protein Tsubulata_031297 [Turnera subulata]